MPWVVSDGGRHHHCPTGQLLHASRWVAPSQQGADPSQSACFIGSMELREKTDKQTVKPCPRHRKKKEKTTYLAAG